MSARHTPGPWSVGMQNGANASIVFAANDDGICQVYGVPLHTLVADVDPQLLRDARLIAAAPELLEALEGFVTELTSDSRNSEKVLTINHPALVQRIANARAAIASATGAA